MVITRDLQINRQFLDSKFEGYKLNSVPLILYSQEIPDIDEVRPSDDQYSFLQQREFSLHNHLHHDPWNSNAVYVVNSEKQILKVLHGDMSEGGLSEPVTVWEIPFQSSRTQGHSNVTMCFASQDLVLVSNGDGSLHIISTSNRKQLTEVWKELHCESVLSGIRLTDARSLPSGHLHCLYCNVDSKQTYITHLCFLSDQEGRWKLENSALVFGKGSVDYAALNSNCQRAIVIGQIEAKSQEYIENENKKPSEGVKETSFEWQQNFEEIKVWVKCPDQSNTSVTISSTNFLVKSYTGSTILQGKFYRPIEDNLSVWKFIERENQSTLEINLKKKDEGSMWTQLFESSDFRGKELPNLDLTNEINNRLSHLTSETEDVGGATVLNCGQLEECDMTDGDGRLLVQYDLTSPLTSPILKMLTMHDSVMTESNLEEVPTMLNEVVITANVIIGDGLMVNDHPTTDGINVYISSSDEDSMDLVSSVTLWPGSAVEQGDINSQLDSDSSSQSGSRQPSNDLMAPNPLILNSASDEADLGNGQWLMVTPRGADHPPQFCLRSDVDGLIYDVDDDSPQHVATLCAFGFVQASKTSRIFSFLPSDNFDTRKLQMYTVLVKNNDWEYVYEALPRPETVTAAWNSTDCIVRSHAATLSLDEVTLNTNTPRHHTSPNRIHLELPCVEVVFVQEFDPDKINFIASIIFSQTTISSLYC